MGPRGTAVFRFGTSIALVCLVSGVLRASQAAQEAGAPMAEQVFKNVQVLKGIPVDQFMGTMGIFSAALGMSCEDCHSADDRNWDGFAADNARKRTARRMIEMVTELNRANFSGRRVVTCYTCHRGSDRPKVTPDLDALYGPLSIDQPDVITQAQGASTPDQIFDKYLQAVGGAPRAAGLTGLVGRGTSNGYGPEGERALELYARTPNQRTLILHTPSGDNTTTFDGRAGWVAAPFRPVAVLALTGQELDGVRLETDLLFPARIKQALTQWRVGRSTTIGDRSVEVVQGTAPGGAIATLYFDSETGLLTRVVHYADSPVGRIPTRIDLSDYREVAGVKLPFAWTRTWLDGRDSVKLMELRPNVTIEASRFARPAPSVAPAANAPAR